MATVADPKFMHLLSTSQVARLLERSTTRVQQLARAGEIDCVETQIGRLFHPHDVEAFLQARERTSRDEADPA